MEISEHALQWDQAEGLRRLMAPRFTRTIAVIGANNISLSLISGLTQALIKANREVLIINNGTGDNFGSQGLGLQLSRAMTKMATGSESCSFCQVAEGVHLLRMDREPAIMTEFQASSRITELLQKLAGVRITLAHISAFDLEEMARVVALVQEIIIVMQPTLEGVQEAYRLIKVFSLLKVKYQFHILIGEADNEWEAMAQFKHLAWVASRFLQVSLTFVGWLPPLQSATMRSATMYQHLIDQIDQWPYPKKETIALDAFLYGLFLEARQTSQIKGA